MIVQSKPYLVGPRYCVLGDLMQLCPEGHYCPAGTGWDWQQCVPGTYNNDTGLSSLDECKPCLGGYYCEHYAAVEPTDKCDPGYYCEYGTDRPRPTGNVTMVNGSCIGVGSQTGMGNICPVGSYCPIGSTLPLPCGAGTYSNVTGLEACLQCPAGFYCLEGRLVLVLNFLFYIGSLNNT